MVALAVASGYALAIGEVAGLYIALALIGSVAVLLDFRVGAVLLLLMLPMSPSDLFPRALMQVTGLNPLNLLVGGDVVSYVISGRARQAGPVLRQPLVWLYILPMCVAALIGMPHVRRDSDSCHPEPVAPRAVRQRTADICVVTLVKGIVIVAIALMIGAAAARSRKPEGFIVALAASAWIIALIQLGFILLMGMPLAEMASPDARDFYAPIGMHANTLGRIHLSALRAAPVRLGGLHAAANETVPDAHPWRGGDGAVAHVLARRHWRRRPGRSPVPGVEVQRQEPFARAARAGAHRAARAGRLSGRA